MKKEIKFCEAATAAFTGHRWYDSSRKQSIMEKLEGCVREAYKNGITNFISGMPLACSITLSSCSVFKFIILVNKLTEYSKSYTGMPSVCKIIVMYLIGI